MPRYEVYATRWDDPHVVDELIPAKGLEFSMPLSEHGECSFTATVEPGWSSWRSSLTKDVSGILVTRDGQPVWSGWLVEDRESGPRSFTFRAIEWGFFFAAVPAIPDTYTDANDCLIFRDLIDQAQAIEGQDVAVVTGSALGAAKSDRKISAWDDTTVEREFRSVAEAEGGPEWYFGTTGTMEQPVRQLYLGDRLGNAEPTTVLEFVEDTAPAAGPGGIPVVGLLGDLFPGSMPVVPTRRAGGNVIAKARTRQGDSATVAVAVNGEAENAQKRKTATSALLAAGWPRMTRTKTYSDVTVPATLQRHANADLAKAEGITTGYSLVTLDDDPDWTQCPRGSSVIVSIDSDIYAGPRPLQFASRLLNLTVRVADTGSAQVQWDTATVQETT
jgi:hypothetical protein